MDSSNRNWTETSYEFTCLCKSPPENDTLDELKPNTGFMNFIDMGMMFSLVLILDVVLNFTEGLLESLAHIRIRKQFR